MQGQCWSCLASRSPGPPAIEVSGAFEVGLQQIGMQPRQAVWGKSLWLGARAAAVTDVASDAFGDLAPAGPGNRGLFRCKLKPARPCVHARMPLLRA